MRPFASFAPSLRLAIALLALAFPFVAPPPAAATLVTELSLDDLAAQADAVVHGRVVRVAHRTLPVRGRAMPMELVTLAVDEWLVGQGGAEIVIREVGGTAGGTTVAREGTPTYRRGEEVVVFLRHDGEAYTTLGLAQGRFRIVGDTAHGRFVERDLDGLVLVDRGRSTTRAGEAVHEPRREASAFLADVRGRTRGRRGR